MRKTTSKLHLKRNLRSLLMVGLLTLPAMGNAAPTLVQDSPTGMYVLQSNGSTIKEVLGYIEKTGNNSGEIIAAADSLVGRVEAVFTPTDNVVMAAESAVAEILNEAGIPHYTGADSFVQAGGFATCGVNYTELGNYTADMAFDILTGGAVPEFHVMDGGIITVNTDTAKALGIDYSVFSTMANTVVEVTTEQ